MDLEEVEAVVETEKMAIVMATIMMVGYFS